MRDDAALLRAARAKWLVVPSISEADDRTISEKVDAASADESYDGSDDQRPYLRIALPEGALEIDESDLTIGSHGASRLSIDSPWVSLLPHGFRLQIQSD